MNDKDDQLKKNKEIFELCKNWQIINEKRQFSHWFYSFKKEDLKNLERTLIEQKQAHPEFLYISNIEETKPSEFRLELITEGVITLKNINYLTIQFIELSELYNSEYDGFEIAVTTNPENQYFKK